MQVIVDSDMLVAIALSRLISAFKVGLLLQPGCWLPETRIAELFEFFDSPEVLVINTLASLISRNESRA